MNDKVHLLLIDDEKNYLLVLETLLTEAGWKYRCRGCQSGDRAERPGNRARLP